MTTATVSAPGKVLLAGGYLVLDRAYQGLVFGLDARIYVHVQAARNLDTVSPTDGRSRKIVVRSPQFVKAQWVYSYSADRSGNVSGVRVTQTDE